MYCNWNNVLCKPGTEHLYALPVSTRQFFKWIKDGSVKKGKVLLVRSQKGSDNEFTEEVEAVFSASSEKSMEEIHATNAKIVIFYCEDGRYSSPRDVKNYHAWLRKNHPQSKQRCMLLDFGIRGIISMLEQRYSVEEFRSLFAAVNSIRLTTVHHP
jgi:hypothetical protein